jgi:hypothetical protein
VHWIDPSSRELLDLVVERVARLPVLLLVTFRPEFQPPRSGQAHVTVLVLNRLDRREGAALVRRVVGTEALPGDASAVEPTRSQNITVSCRRSAVSCGFASINAGCGAAGTTQSQPAFFADVRARRRCP